MQTVSSTWRGLCLRPSLCPSLSMTLSHFSSGAVEGGGQTRAYTHTRMCSMHTHTHTYTRIRTHTPSPRLFKSVVLAEHEPKPYTMNA
jgi:hypothetical protein